MCINTKDRGSSQESRGEGLEIELWIGAVTCRDFAEAVSPQKFSSLVDL